MPTHEPALNLPNPWAAVGRDTEAGRALFALYNGFGHARSRGNDYSQVNKIKTLRHIATHGVPEFPVPKPPPPKKPEVKVPHFPHKNYCYDQYHPVDFISRRRRAFNILQQIRDDSYVVDLPPMPKGPLLDDAEKARLQEVFYWSNRNLGPDPPAAEPVRRLPKKGSVEEQELLLNNIAKEVEDREAFLSEMEEYGKGEQYRSQIMFEIQQRVGQMKLLHENITEQEMRENLKQSKADESRLSILLTAPPPPPQVSYARGQGRNENTISRFKTASSPIYFENDPRFERSSDSTRQADTTGLSFRTSRAERSGYRSSQQETSHSTRNETPEPSSPNVVRTASYYNATAGNADEAASFTMAESVPPTPPPSSFPTTAPAKNKNSRLYSAGGSSTYNSTPSENAAMSTHSMAESLPPTPPPSSFPTRAPPTKNFSFNPPSSRLDSAGGSSACKGLPPGNATMATGSRGESIPPTPPPSSFPTTAPKKKNFALNVAKSKLDSAGGSSAYSASQNGSTARTPMSISSNPRSRANPYGQSGENSYGQSGGNSYKQSGDKLYGQSGDDSGYMTGMTSHSNANYPSGSTPWTNGCSPVACSPVDSPRDYNNFNQHYNRENDYNRPDTGE